jgi:hypothetical protein
MPRPADTLRRVAYRDTGGAGFRPRATLGLLYFFGFFWLFCFLLIAPTLWHAYQSVGADASQWESAQQSVREAFRPRFWLALGLAAAITVLGGRLRLLPGTR